VRQLIPAVLAGSSMEDLVLARADYGRLDEAGSPCRLRFDSTAVDVRHTPDQRGASASAFVDGAIDAAWRAVTEQAG
jgi:spermidine dehydrogenase